MAGNGEPRHRNTTTLRDVSEAAGLGMSTVSRVLRNHGSFSKATRDRVMKAVEELGYVPNRIAGTLASSGSNLVGIVIPSLHNIVFPDLLSGAAVALDPQVIRRVLLQAGEVDGEAARPVQPGGADEMEQGNERGVTVEGGREALRQPVPRCRRERGMHRDGVRDEACDGTFRLGRARRRTACQTGDRKLDRVAVADHSSGDPLGADVRLDRLDAASPPRTPDEIDEAARAIADRRRRGQVTLIRSAHLNPGFLFARNVARALRQSTVKAA